jgi:hypothetical protein
MRQPWKRKLRLSRAGYHRARRAAHFSLRKPVQATECRHKLASIASSIIQTVCRPSFHIINHAHQPLDFSLSHPATFPHTSLLPDLFLARLDPPPTRSFVPSAPTNTDLFRKSAKPVDSQNAGVPHLRSFSMVPTAKSSSRAAEAYMFGDVLCEDLISTFLVSIQSLLSYLAS